MAPTIIPEDVKEMMNKWIRENPYAENNTNNCTELNGRTPIRQRLMDTTSRTKKQANKCISDYISSNRN